MTKTSEQTGDDALHADEPIIHDHAGGSRSENSDLRYPFDEVPEPGQVIEVAPGVLWLRMPLPWSLDHINLYIIEDGDGYAIVDTGVNGSKSRDLWDRIFAGPLAGRPITRVILTHLHPDHCGLAGWLVERFDVPLYMTRSEYTQARILQLDSHDTTPDYMIGFFRRAGLSEEALDTIRQQAFNKFARATSPLPGEYRRLRHGDRLTLGAGEWQIVEGSGHSPEHACLMDVTRGLFIAGDQVLPEITSNVSVHGAEPFANPLKEWLQSLDRMETLDPALLVLPAHGRPFYGLHERADAIRQSHHRRLALISEIAEEPCTGLQITGRAFRRHLHGMDFVLALGETIAHIHFLEERGAMTRIEDGAVHRFQRTRLFDAAELD